MERPKSAKQAVGELVLALMQLIETLQITEDAGDLSINFYGRQSRIDIATVAADGHLDRWLCGFDVTPSTERFGQSITLPQPGGVQH